MGRRTNKSAFPAVSVFLLALASTTAWGKTITVDDDGPADYSNIQAAINNASTGDTVEVKPGTYTGPGNRDIDFLGKAITVRSTDPNDPNIVAATVIDCNGTVETPHRGFTFDSHEGRASVLSGLTITGGYGRLFDPPPPPWPTLPEAGKGYSGGGAVWIKHSSPTIINCVIKGNLVGCAYTPTHIRGHYGYGGGIFCGRDTSPMISNCTLLENTSYSYGGAIYCEYDDSTPIVRDCKIIGNEAKYGAGISCRNESNPRVVNCTLRANTAKYIGGGVYCSSATLISCLLIGNRAASYGGAVYCSGDGGYMQLLNCTLSGNAAKYGGGLYCYDYVTAVVRNSILWDNSAELGAQIAVQTWTFYCDGTYCSPEGYWNHPSSCVASYSDIQGGPESVAVESLSTFDWGAGNIDAKPIFQEVGYWADVCDPNTVVEPNDPNAVWIDGSYHLVGGSPCLDAGDNNSVPPDTDDLDDDGDTAEAIPFDCDGDPRFLDDPCSPDTGNPSLLGPPVVDMGAYEGVHQGFVLSTETLTVWEASTATFTVALSLDPHGTVEATVARESGDADIAVLSGGILTFDSSNYSKPQTVTLAAAQDDDSLSGNALILITAPGFYSRTVSATEGETLFVDANAVGANSGTSWPDAFIRLQDAFAVASDYPGIYEVRVAEGIYKPDVGGGQTPGGRQAAFQLISGMTVYGGFPSGGGSWEARDPNLHETILSGDLAGDDVDVNDPCDLLTEPTRGENSYHVLTGHNAGPGSILDGFIITAGNANGSSQNHETAGGGMYNDNSSPRVINCTFSNNSASSSGGGMSNWNGSDPTVTSCTFSGNCAGYGGGGMDNAAGSSPTVNNCTFSGNVALRFEGGGISNGISSTIVTDCTFRGNLAYSGGGMSNWRSTVAVVNCVFSGNSAGFGAGMNNYESSPAIINCTFGGNVAYYVGGAMDNGLESSPTVTNCTFTGNTAGTRGGGLYNTAGSNPTLTNCTLGGNSAGELGGAVFNNRSSPTVTNCTFTGNAAGTRGGGLYNTVYGNPTLTNCTLSGNSAGDFGGAIFNNIGSSPVLSNCILWDNTAPSGAQIYNDATSSSTVTYSDVQDDGSGPGNIDADPCFIEPGYWADANDHNCHVEPNHPNAVWIEGNYHLLASSPCIDAGDNNSVASDFLDLDGDGNTAESIPCDLGGNARIADGDNDDNPVVDMGAYEFFWPPIEVSMKLTPQTLNPVSHGKWVKAHFVLPEGFAVEDVDATIPAKITEPFEPDIESEYMNVFVNDYGLIEIEACFERAQFCAAGIDGGVVEVTAVGSLTSEQQFYGTDAVKINNNAIEHLANLASYWLEESCGQPDWCGGLDLDRDGALDFVDFALFDGCCVETIP